MRTTLRGKISLLFMMCAMLLAIPAVALADNINDDIADTATSTLQLTAGDANSTGTAQVKIVSVGNNLNADGNIDCNIDAATQSVTLKFNTPAGVSATALNGATATPGEMKFTACDVFQSVKFSASSSAVPGAYTVTATIVQNNTTGEYNNNVNIPIKVNAPAVADADGDTVADASDNCVNVANANQADADADGTGDACDSTPNPPPPDADGDTVADASDNCPNMANANQADADSDGTGDACDPTPNPNTAPNVSVAGVTDGASYEKGSVPTATCDVTDAEDTNESASPVIDSSALNSYGLGSEKVTCSYTDAGGLKASDSKTYSIVDNTVPELTLPANITEEATGANGATVNFSASANDAVYGSVSVTCSPESGSTFKLGTTTVNCSATDGSGNKASDSFTVTVKDTTAPKLTLPDNIIQEATGPNGNEVTYSASATDAVDPSVAVSCTPNSGSMFAIDTTTVNCEATDAAGNKATSSFTIKVQDTTAPTNIQFVGNISDNDPFFFGDVPAAPTCTADDSGSGIQGCVVTGYSTAVGTHTLTATATDKAGNKSTKTLSYTVKPYTFNGFYQPVDMGGVYNTVKGGSTVPLKFELFKGATELTSTSYINQPLKTQKVDCTTGTTEDTIELLATGGTSLRYDSTGGQYIYNWKTPTGAGSCYKVTVSATDGSSSITAYFKLK